MNIKKLYNFITFNFITGRGGFTIVETMVALAIISFSLTALISLTSQGISNTNFVKNKLIASYLAREGIELVRNLRDSDLLGDPLGGWGAFTASLVSNSCTTACFPYFDDIPGSPSYTILFFPPSSCVSSSSLSCILGYSDGRYFYPPGAQPSNFERVVSAIPISTYGMKVTSTVNWRQGSVLKTASFSENIFDTSYVVRQYQ